MPFEHQLLPKQEMESITGEDGSRFYITPTGERYPSVTTVLGSLPNAGLDAWKLRVGEAEANRIANKAAIRGKAMHSMLETHLLNQPLNFGSYMPNEVQLFKPIKKYLDENVSVVKGIELPLYSRKLKAAGTTDLAAVYRNLISDVDFKTSFYSKSKDYIKSYFLQTTTYSMMLEEMYGIDVSQIVILISSEYDIPQEFVENNHKYREEVRSIFSDYAQGLTG